MYIFMWFILTVLAQIDLLGSANRARMCIGHSLLCIRRTHLYFVLHIKDEVHCVNTVNRK